MSDKEGFAIDGNSVIASVTATAYVEQHDGDESSTGRITTWAPGGIVPGEWAIDWSLTKALRDVEAWLVEWLDTLGYDVEFA